MNFKLLAKLLGILAALIGSFMLFSLIWADSDVGFHTRANIESSRLESEGIWGLVYGAIISWVICGLLYWYGRGADAKIYRKEAMAVVGLSWALATVLGALPYIFSGTSRGPSIRVLEDSREILVTAPRLEFWNAWEKSAKVSDQEFTVLKVVTNASARGVNESQLRTATGIFEAPEIFANLQQEQPWQDLLLAPAQNPQAPADRASHFRIKWVPMGIVDAMFESQSGFSTTGATVLCDLEDPHLVPHCILFWRSSTHFLGGLGIIVLFVVLLGHGSAGKALMRAEMPGPTYESSNARMQHTAWLFAGIYIILNIVLALILAFLGMSAFDAICHAFGTMATGGFSTYVRDHRAVRPRRDQRRRRGRVRR